MMPSNFTSFWRTMKNLFMSARICRLISFNWSLLWYENSVTGTRPKCLLTNAFKNFLCKPTYWILPEKRAIASRSLRKIERSRNRSRFPFFPLIRISSGKTIKAAKNGDPHFIAIWKNGKKNLSNSAWILLLVKLIQTFSRYLHNEKKIWGVGRNYKIFYRGSRTSLAELGLKRRSYTHFLGQKIQFF